MGKLSRYDMGENTSGTKKKSNKHDKPISTSISERETTKIKHITAAGLPKKSRSVSNRMRDIKRLLGKVTAADAKEALERKLKSLETRAEENEQEKEQNVAIQKSRQARFLDMKRLQKRLKKAENEEQEQLIRNDIEYIKSFPSGKPYLSLFDSKLSEASKTERDALRRKAAITLRERRDENGSDSLDNDDFFQGANEDENDDE
jgi:hypothetical protein